MRLLGHGSPGCKAGVEIPAKQHTETSPNIAQIIVPSEFTVIQSTRLSQTR